MTKIPNGRFLINMAALVIIIAGMRAASSFLVPLLLALFVATIFSPPFIWLTRKHIPKSLALIIVITGAVGIGFLFGVLIEIALADFYSSLTEYQMRLQEGAKQVINWIRDSGIRISDTVFLEYFDPTLLMSLLGKLLGGLGGMLSNALLIILTVIFILLETSSFSVKLQAIAHDPKASLSRYQQFIDTVKHYLVIKSIISLVTGLVITLWLTILGVKHPILWGLIAFLLNYVPTIGSIIAALPPILLALIDMGFGTALFVLSGYFVVNFVMGSVIEPRFMGHGLGVSTLVIFLSLIFWGWVFGPIGMLLSVLLTMTVKIALDSNENTIWISKLMGSAVTVKSEKSDKKISIERE